MPLRVAGILRSEPWRKMIQKSFLVFLVPFWAKEDESNGCQTEKPIFIGSRQCRFSRLDPSIYDEQSGNGKQNWFHKFVSFLHIFVDRMRRRILGILSGRQERLHVGKQQHLQQQQHPKRRAHSFTDPDRDWIPKYKIRSTTTTNIILLRNNQSVERNTQVRRNYTTPHKTQMIDTTINLLVNRTECTNLSGTTLTLRLAVKSDNSSPSILFRDSEKLDATIKLSVTLPTHSCRCPHGRTKSCFTHNNFSKFHKLQSL